MPHQPVAGQSIPRALRAKEAGELLAELVGMPEPISAAKMWRYGRQGVVPTLRFGRLRYFRTTELERFANSGGCGLEDRQGGA